MYLKFYGLAEDPFNLTPDSRFLYLSRKHREALANLLYGIQQRKGFITLTGEIGSGKTTLCRALLNELDMETTRVALILNSLLSEIELLQTINEDFGIPANSDSKRDLIRELNQFLIRENEAGHNVVLIIDEAQNLSVAVLEEIRMLSNLETETSKLIQIVLMGQPELQDILSMQELEQLNQRISVRYHISALDRQDVPYYIKHRLFVARAQVDIDFTPGAHKLIFEYSKGIPRKINVLCDRCLLAAYSRVTYQIDEAIVKSSIHEIQGELGGRGEARTQGKSPRPIKWLVIAVILPAASIFIAAGVFLGIRLAGPKYVPEIPAEPSGGPLDSRPVYLAHDVPVPYGESLQAGNPGSNNPAPSPTPTPKPTATPVPPKRYYYNWQYDKSGICRVDNAAYALPASMITWLRLWNIETDLDYLRDLDYNTLSRIDIASQDRALSLRRIAMDAKFKDVIHYDLPFIAVFSQPPPGVSSAIVVLRVEGAFCVIADPLEGQKTIRREVFDSGSCRYFLMYFDKNDFEGTLLGEDSQRVLMLQEYLKGRGFLKGQVTTVFDARLTGAIKNLQRYYKLEPTGLLTQETVMMITSRMFSGRPRLYSSGGED